MGATPLLEMAVPLFIAFVAVLAAFVVHEYAHAYTAWSLGDPVPKYEGRLTLNPRVHVDPWGAMVLMISMALMLAGKAGILVGWARPVRFDRRNLRDDVRGGALIALAGPLSNFAMAALAGLPLRFGLLPEGLVAGVFLIFVQINVALGIFNLIPVPPLDGWKVVQGVLPRPTARAMQGMEVQAGMAPLFALLALLLVVPAAGAFLIGWPYHFLVKLFTGPFRW